LRLRLETEHRGLLLRCWGAGYNAGEVAYALLGLRGPRAEIEFPSDWHEHRRAWVRLGCGILSIAFSFPWKRVVPDEGQCSGPTYGFYFFRDTLVLKWGKDTGRSTDAKTSRHIYLPWSWSHVRHDYLNPDGSLHHACGPQEYSAPDETKQQYPYRYVRDSGEIQERTATINGEEMEWRWRSLLKFPWPRKIRRTINIEFNDEVGERTGSWKGGTIGCGWDWKHGEQMVDALRRMERERKFT
jgi:hypothetical protein